MADHPLPLPLLPQDNVDTPLVDPQDLGYGTDQPLDSSLEDMSQQQSMRPRTPRELLKKLPRRLSIASNSSYGSVGSPFEALRGTLTPTSWTPTPTLTDVTTNTAPSLSSGQADDNKLTFPALPITEGPVCMQANVPTTALGLAKPTASRPGNGSASIPSLPADAFHKPSDRALEKQARKALLQSSRRKRPSHPGQDIAAEAAAKKRRASAGEDSKLPAVSNSSKGGASKCVPLAGWRDGVYLFTGIVMRRDGRYKNGKQAKLAFIRLDNPNGPLDGPGHLMNAVEFGTEMACYSGLTFEHQWTVNRIPVVDFTTGRPLMSSSTHTSTLAPALHQTNSDTESQSAFVCPTSTNPVIGIAHIKGEEERFNNMSQPFDCYFPYACSSAPAGPGSQPTASAQGIRAGDLVTVIVCKNLPGVGLQRMEMELRVLSVTSFGYVNGVSTSSDDPKNEILSFPTTSVLGVRYGSNWNTTLSQPAAAVACMQPSI